MMPTQRDANPFFHRGPVRDPQYFFGRKREIDYVSDLLRQGQSVSISGPRRRARGCFLTIIPAASYSPRGSTPKYHRRWRA